MDCVFKLGFELVLIFKCVFFYLLLYGLVILLFFYVDLSFFFYILSYLDLLFFFYILLGFVVRYLIIRLHEWTFFDMDVLLNGLTVDKNKHIRYTHTHTHKLGNS